MRVWRVHSDDQCKLISSVTVFVSRSRTFPAQWLNVNYKSNLKPFLGDGYVSIKGGFTICHHRYQNTEIMFKSFLENVKFIKVNIESVYILEHCEISFHVLKYFICYPHLVHIQYKFTNVYTVVLYWYTCNVHLLLQY